MGLFKKDGQKEKIIELLHKSNGDFSFDQKSIKNHLLANLAPRSNPKFSAISWLVPKWGFALAIMVLFIITGSTAALADSAKPGDILYSLDKFQEKVVTRLPLPEVQKAKIQANIVSERANELQRIKATAAGSVKIQAIKESEQSLNQAIEKISETQAKLELSGKAEKNQKLDAVLDRLEVLANDQEQKAETIKVEVMDKKIQAEIDQDLIKIRQSKKRVREQIERRKQYRELKYRNRDSNDSERESSRDSQQQEND